MSLLATAESVGSVVRRATLERRKLSEGFIKVPSQSGYAIPVSSSSGHEVLWKAVRPKETWTRPVAATSQLGLDRSADIQAVRELISPEGCSSQSNDKKRHAVQKKPKAGVKLK
ncbi:hypothetical protein MPTK1_2g25810 [Marchantia polymorpha subsp. ruderalis]|uniref:Uncharacterized protein n=1 Tax=Marchantia polymorpha TaxID=3197 RepID=A0A2R6XBC8_MARPO|nr:hypothetical protein MARPO_0025s0097 [Marchantia polymorpha]BBN03719.1 hypothetical protein Mp_2g25810 [Marchantia polymorpha subsp. ruderalis]|eukprot:PTQ43413.1 hypothetical protein MARPO_0025s0097 [Marchantia polymorpha]